MPPPEPAAPIIDAHTHLAPASPAFQEWAGRTGADPVLPGLLREMDENHVERAVVIGHWKPQEGERDGPFANKTNNDLVTVLRAHRDRFRGLLTVNLDAEGPVDLYAVDAHLREPISPGSNASRDTRPSVRTTPAWNPFLTYSSTVTPSRSSTAATPSPPPDNCATPTHWPWTRSRSSGPN